MRRTRIAAIALVAVIAAGLAATGAPANTSAASATGAVCGAELFDSLTALRASSTARTAASTVRKEKDPARYSGSTEIGQKTPGKPTAGTIDVYFHVITKVDGFGAVANATIAAQIRVLNETFAGTRGGVDSGFRFRLNGADVTANDAWFAQETFEDEVAMKVALKDGGPSDLNIYTTGGGGYLGWAYYPSIVASRQYAVLDGVVVHYGSLPGGSPPYDLGFTATHEVGHWLGLAHTFEQGCIGHGDYVNDTPSMSEPTGGCPAGKDTCTRGSGLDPIHNYMDYSDDACFQEFTRGQVERAQKQFAHWRLKRS